jgi:flavin-dependent dehydrogenase
LLKTKGRVNQVREIEMNYRLDLDFLVVGGGPAGSACAIALARSGARVAVVESSDMKRFRIGETISASVASFLRPLGVGISSAALPAPPVASAWGHANANIRPCILNPYGHDWLVDRRQFDRLLFERAGRDGAHLLLASRIVSARRCKRMWHFDIAASGSIIPGRSPFVVEATGRNGRSRFETTTSRLWIDRLVGVAIKGPQVTTEGPHSGAPMVEAMDRGWLYSVVLPGGRMLIVLFTDSDLLPKQRRKVDGFITEVVLSSKQTRKRCRLRADGRLGCKLLVFDARSSIRRVAATDGWLAAGDALMAFDPLCGQGVARALSSGLQAAELLLEGERRRRESVMAWTENNAQKFCEYVTQRLKTYSIETRWSDSVFWRRRQAP